MTYAIVSIGGKQYRVQEGERLLVDRLAVAEGKTFQPRVLLVGGDGDAEYAPKGVQVTAKVVGEARGEKIRIGKYRRRTGYRRHTGFRAALSQIEIESIGKRSAAAKAEPKAKAAAPAAPKEERVAGMPKGYEELTVTAIADAAPGWRRPMLEAALEYERSHAGRKGALAALESALESKEES
jgi:large subunit ribosomal protein L21